MVKAFSSGGLHFSLLLSRRYQHYKKDLMKYKPAQPLFLLFVCSVFGITALFPQHTFADQHPDGFSFAQAWEILIDKNDTLKAARSEVEEKTQKKKSARALYYPEISLTANYLVLDDDVKLSPDDLFDSMPAGDQLEALLARLGKSYGFSPATLSSGLTSTMMDKETFHSGLTAVWPIYTGGRITAAQGIAEEQEKEAANTLELKKIEQFEKLVQYYFGTVLAKNIYETRLEVEEGLKKHKEHAALLEEQGQIARVERLQSEASYDKAVVERKKAFRDLEIAKAALGNLLKTETSAEPVDPLFMNKDLPSMAGLITDTIAKHPGLRILKAKQAQASELVNIERGKYLPAVALFGSYTLHEDDSLTAELAPDWMVGAGLTVAITDRSGRKGKYEAALATVRRVEYLKSQAESDLQVLVEKTYRQARQAIEEFEGLKSSRALARESVNLRVKAFGQGLGTSLDVVDAELFLAQVKTQQAVAVYNYIKSLGTLMAISTKQELFFRLQNNKGSEEQECNF